MYAADTEEQPRYTTSPGVRKVANFTIPMPTLPGVMEGEKVDLSIKMYFGEVELRVEGNCIYTRRSCMMSNRAYDSCYSRKDLWYNLHIRYGLGKSFIVPRLSSIYQFTLFE